MQKTTHIRNRVGAVRAYVFGPHSLLGNGGTPISPPEDKPYRERTGGVRDDFGNAWYISTYLGGG